MSENRIYLDWNASAPLRPEARVAMIEALSLIGNPSSVHSFGREIRRRIEDARVSVARLVGAEPFRVVFTSGGVEANHLALLGIENSLCWTSEIEHESVLAARSEAERLPITSGGVIDLESLDCRLERFLRIQSTQNSPKLLVSTMLVNNETGVIQPIAEIASRVRRVGGLLHCDAVQALGRAPIDMAKLDVDMMTVSSHKIGGPSGVGALILGPKAPPLTPILRGGGQESRQRAGTENIIGIIGFGRAAMLALQEQGVYSETVAPLRDRLEREVRLQAPHVRIFGAESPRVANTCCLGVEGLRSETLLIKLDLAGIAVSAGAACSSGRARPSHVLKAMGCNEESAASAIRVSMGTLTSAADIDRFLDVWLSCVRR
ncbi:Cysteine desulfurase [Azospirillaceae bacterium]